MPKIISEITTTEKIITEYGYKKNGASRFVVVAPHAAGDDYRTGKIARKIAENLNGFLIINNKYFKASNSKAAERPEFVEDFNKLYWSRKKEKHIWSRKKPAMQTFFFDIEKYCILARDYSPDHKAIIIYIHGMKFPDVAIDLGVGLKAKKNKLRFYSGAQSLGSFSGAPTFPIGKLKELQKLLEKAMLTRYNLGVSIGQYYAAWSKRIAVQFHKHNGRNDMAIQIEINKEIRQKISDINFITSIISQIFKNVF